MCILLETLDTEAALPKLRFSYQLGYFFAPCSFILEVVEWAILTFMKLFARKKFTLPFLMLKQY